jgi:hypothetical protein
VIAAALDAGSAFGAVLIWVTVTVSNTELHWWGNDGYTDSECPHHPSFLIYELTSSALDGRSEAVRFTLENGTFFGPDTWK